jgi:hypothetical protein
MELIHRPQVPSDRDSFVRGFNQVLHGWSLWAVSGLL